MTAVRWVRQVHEGGCGIAALAMVSGDSYADVLCEVAEWDPGVLIDGLHTGPKAFEYLRRRGYTWETVFRREQTGGAWPPPPFAPVHIAQVIQPSGMGHWVVMDREGVVYDPLTERPRQLGEWYAPPASQPAVNQVTGFRR